MELEKQLIIQKFTRQRAINAPFILETEAVRSIDCTPSRLTFDDFWLEEYNLDSRDLIGKFLNVSLKSKELKIENKLCLMELEKDELLIQEVKKTEKSIWRYYCVPPLRDDEIIYTASFKSAGEGDGIHPTPLPCPFYELNLPLNEQEYARLRELPGNTVMKVNFKLIDLD